MMPVLTIVHDSFLDILVYFISGRRLFRHTEELLVLPTEYYRSRGGYDASSPNVYDAVTPIEPCHFCRNQ